MCVQNDVLAARDDALFYAAHVQVTQGLRRRTVTTCRAGRLGGRTTGPKMHNAA
jgi:hypothetical protein